MVFSVASCAWVYVCSRASTIFRGCIVASASSGAGRRHGFPSSRMGRLYSAMSSSSSGGDEPPAGPGTTGKIKVNGVDLYYERYGTGDHVLLCIPGALGSVKTDFPPQMEYFGRPDSGFTIVGFDPRGYGKSRPHDRKFSIDPLFYKIDADDAVGVMQGLGFAEFSLLGWSDGGVCAIIAAANYPLLVKNLVVWGANAYVSETDIENVEKTRDVAQWSARMREPMVAVYEGDFPRMWSDWMDGFCGVYDDETRKGDLCIKETSDVRCPSLVIHGVRDAMCPTFHAEFLAERLSDCSHVTFPEGKHNLHSRYHEHFNKLVADFLLKSTSKNCFSCCCHAHAKRTGR